MRRFMSIAGVRNLFGSQLSRLGTKGDRGDGQPAGTAGPKCAGLYEGLVLTAGARPNLHEFPSVRTVDAGLKKIKDG